MDSVRNDKNKRLLNKLSEAVLNLVFPKKLYCHCCGDFIDKSRIHGLCDSCISKIDWNSDNPFSHKRAGFYFDNVLSCCRYGFYPRKIIHNLKLYQKPYIAEDIGLLMAEKAEYSDDIYELIIPVPMTLKKLKKRGYNQAELLARAVSEELHIPMNNTALIKIRNTDSMRLSGARERSFMQEKAFAIADSKVIRDKHILLVDDVITTGSTVNECSKLLKENGAKKVTVLTFAS